MISKIHLWSAAAALALIGCGDSEEALSASSVSTTPTYGDVAGIVQNRCGICHVGGGVEPSLSGYEGFRAEAVASLGEIASGEMPPGGPALPFYEQELISNWIQQGMPK